MDDEKVVAEDWPEPGDEDFVHNDGTEQSRVQLEQNRKAAADRKAAAEREAPTEG